MESLDGWRLSAIVYDKTNALARSTKSPAEGKSTGESCEMDSRTSSLPISCSLVSVKLWSWYEHSNDPWILKVNAHDFFALHADVNNRGADWRILPSTFWDLDADSPVYSTFWGRGVRKLDGVCGSSKAQVGTRFVPLATWLVLKLSPVC